LLNQAVAQRTIYTSEIARQGPKMDSNTSYPEKQLVQIVRKYGISAEDEEKLRIITDMVFHFPVMPADNKIFHTGFS
jgi:NADPH-dependent ferric siderophore reductase